MICEHCGDMHSSIEYGQERGHEQQYRGYIRCTKPECRHSIMLIGDTTQEIMDKIEEIERRGFEKHLRIVCPRCMNHITDKIIVKRKYSDGTVTWWATGYCDICSHFQNVRKETLSEIWDHYKQRGALIQ